MLPVNNVVEPGVIPEAPGADTRNTLADWNDDVAPVFDIPTLIVYADPEYKIAVDSA